MIFTKTLYDILKILYDAYPETISKTKISELLHKQQNNETIKLYLDYLMDLKIIKRINRFYALTIEGKMITKFFLTNPKIEQLILDKHGVMKSITYNLFDKVYGGGD